MIALEKYNIIDNIQDIIDCVIALERYSIIDIQPFLPFNQCDSLFFLNYKIGYEKLFNIWNI